MRTMAWLGVMALGAGLCAGCGGDDTEPTATDMVDAHVPLDAPRAERRLSGACDPIVPEHCGYPFPSDVYRRPDATLPAGYRVDFPEEALPGDTRPEPWRLSDGFSAGAGPMTYMPGATATGLTLPTAPEGSLDAGSPTVLLEADTGRRVPHFAELDMSVADDDRRALILRPVERLRDQTRYVVAIRGVVDADGHALAPSPAFKALRDDKPFDDESIVQGRALYEQIFGLLERAGVPREELQLAWDFTTASRENNTRWMLHMRDDALAVVGSDGPAYTIDEIQDDVDANIARRIDGTMTVPLYLDQPGPGGVAAYDDSGLPIRTGEAGYPFTILIPRSAVGHTAPAMIVGHGLLGSRAQVQGFAEFANQYNYVVFAVDFVGMASDDVTHILTLTSSGTYHVFKSVADRLQQGLLNFMLAMRMMGGAMAADPATTFDGAPAIDAGAHYYYGGSQGGIFGASLMALYTDVTRGVIAVPGQPYGLLLNRSVDFAPYFAAARIALTDPLDMQLALGLVQMLWDRAEPTGYSAYIRQDLLPDTPQHEVLMYMSFGDHQVSNLGSHVMARAAGIPLVGPPVREVFGIDRVGSPHEGSGLIEFDFGNAPDPVTNIPPSDGQDPHGRIQEVAVAATMVDRFLRTGVIEHLCDGACDPD